MLTLPVVQPRESPLRIMIEDVSDPAIVAETERIIQEIFQAHPLEGRWIVALAASDTRGRWDVGIRGPAGRHFLSFAAPAGRIPELIRHYLGPNLERLRRQPDSS